MQVYTCIVRDECRILFRRELFKERQFAFRFDPKPDYIRNILLFLKKIRMKISAGTHVAEHGNG